MASTGKPCGKRAGPLMLAVLVLSVLLSAAPPYAPLLGTAGAQAVPGDGPPWLNQDFDHRAPLTVDPSVFDFQMVNHPAEVDLNLTAIVGEAGFTLDISSMLLVEYRNDSSGSHSLVTHSSTGGPYGECAVPFRFYKDAHFDPSRNAMGTLTWILDGHTVGQRDYYLYFSALPSSGNGMGLAAPQDPITFGLLDSNYWVQRGMVFYGFDPGEQTGWADVDEVEVVGLYNGTSVRIWNITGPAPSSVMNSTTIASGELLRYSTPDGTYFKVEADKPVLASVSSAMNGGGSAKTFYPSSDRNLVGRDFIIAPYNVTTWHNFKYGVQVYGVEEGRVSIWDMAGNHIRELDVRKDNHTQVLDLKAGTVYHFKATGDVMIEQEAINGFSALPSVTGAPVGRKFFGSIQDFDGRSIIIDAYEPATVTIWDMDYGDSLGSFALNNASGSGAFVTPPKGGQYKVISTGDISVVMGSTEGGTEVDNLGDDITFVSGRGARDFRSMTFHNPGPGTQDHQYPPPYYSNIIFPFFNGTELVANDVHADLCAGCHIGGVAGVDVHSDRPVSVMGLGRGYTDKDAQHRWNDWGTYLAGALLSPRVVVGPAERIALGIDLYPSPSEGAINDTMVHAVEPGRSTTFRIYVTDIGGFTEEVALTRGAAPTGWNASLDMSDVSVTPGQSVEVSLTISVPSNALKDTRVNISVRGDTVRDKGRSTNDTVYAEVVVDPVYFPELAGETVKHVDPGKTATFNLTVYNMGNAHDEISLGIDGQVSAGWTAAVVPATAGLDPLKNTTLRLNVTAPKDSLAGASLVVDVRARSGAWPNRTHVHRTMTIVNQVYTFNASAPSTVKVRPGDEVTIALTLKNLGNGRDVLSFAMGGMRAGWSVGPQAAIGLDPSGSTTVPFKLTAPGKDPVTGRWLEGPGNWTLGVNVSDAGGLHKQLVVRIEVLQVFSVGLTAEEYEISIRSNESAHYVLHILNTGNGNDTYTLSTEARGSFDKSKITVQPSGDGRVVLTVPPPANRERYSTFVVTTNSSGNASASVTLTLRVTYPKVSSSVGEYNCLWILAVAACVFVAVKLAQRRFGKKRN